MRQYFLISYDISDPKRWRKVFKLMKGYGEHVQYSVFISQLTDTHKAMLESKLKDIIHHNEDQVMFVKICPVTDTQLDKKISTIGRAYLPMDIKNFIY